MLLRRDVTLAVVGLLFAIQALVRYSSHLDPDVGWYLYAGGRLLDGATLYRDIVEVNPPLALWLCAGIVAVARWAGVDAAVLFQTTIFLLTVMSFALTARFLAAATDVTAATRHLLLIFIAALLLFVPAGDFGQRDHVGVLLVMPWVFLRWNRLLDHRVPWIIAVFVGASAALGMWLKPHFFVVLIAVEVTMLFAGRDLRTILRVETMTIVVFGVIYILAVRFIWSSMLLAKVALLGSRAYIPLYGVPVEEVAVQLILPIALAVTAVANARLLTEKLNLLHILVFVAGVALVCAYALQAGFRYQVIPALCFMALAASFGLARVVAGEVRFDNQRQRLAPAAAAFAILAVFAGAWPQSPAYSGQLFEEAIAAEAPNGRTIFIASNAKADPFPLVNENGFIWASRFSSLWLSPYVATKLDEEGGPGDDIARFELDATVTDLIDFQPDIVFVDEAPERPYYRGAPLDYLSFWGNDGRFFGFWKNYERRGTAGDFAVYVRKKEPAD